MSPFSGRELLSAAATTIVLAACSTPVGFAPGAGGGESGGGGAPLGGTTNGGALPNGGGFPSGAANGGTIGLGGTLGSGGTPSGGGTADSGGALGNGGSITVGGAASSGGTGVSGGASPGAEPCPAGHTFCSGFEANSLPEGAVFRLNGDPATEWTRYFEVDSSEKNSGTSSLRVRPVSEVADAYKMLSVPSGGAAFWVRFYVRSDLDLGSNDHNVLGQASGSDEPNDSVSVEFAEDVGIAFNSQDNVRWPEGYGRLMDGSTMPFTLPKDTWHCIEIHFDGTARVQELFIGGELKMSADDYPASTKAFTRYKFGYNALHGTNRVLWYDDLAVGPERLPCLN
jgi:hypothetical protein